MIVVAGDLLRLITILPDGPPPAFGLATASIDFTLDGQGVRSAAWCGQGASAVRLLSRVGALDSGPLTAAMAARGVEAIFATTTDATTGVIARICESDAPANYVSLGASAKLAPEDIPPKILDGASWLHVSGFLLYDPATRPGARALIDQAKELNIGVSVDPSSANHLRAATAEAFIEWTEGVDLVFPNLDETRVLVGASGPFIDFDLLGHHYPHAVVKLGAMGAAYVGQGVREQTAASRVDVVDSTGVGDAFAAGFLTSWIEAADPKTSLGQGNAFAQMCLGKRGALP